MLPQKYRISLPVFISLNLNPAKKFQNQFFSVSIKKTDNDAVKFVFIVPKRVSKLSTRRNRTKRVLSECFRPFLSHLKPGFLFAVYSRKILLKEKPKDLTEVVKKTLEEAGVLV